MTYSQIWNNSGNEADILYLEQQIETVKKEIKTSRSCRASGNIGSSES